MMLDVRFKAYRAIEFLGRPDIRRLCAKEATSSDALEHRRRAQPTSPIVRICCDGLDVAVPVRFVDLHTAVCRVVSRRRFAHDCRILSKGGTRLDKSPAFDFIFWRLSGVIEAAVEHTVNLPQVVLVPGLERESLRELGKWG